ncbi:hypothetical protein NIES4071_31730 [Calothrix sp. NIES-4071]|nr:hypothetical protein NIES4071_31730 [Calothrix sp. NIES-4071]BAZ57493.1 hypothetical protein NIES4105_31670 [Calothrix sp. NIES-4105]
MLWKLAVSAIMLPAYLGITAVDANAAVTPVSATQPEVAQESVENAAPQYYANNYNYESNCNRGYRRQSYGGYQKQNYYRPQHSGYHQTNYYRPQHNGYKKYHNNGYHNNGYHNNGYHNNGYHNNGYHNNGYGH